MKKKKIVFTAIVQSGRPFPQYTTAFSNNRPADTCKYTWFVSDDIATISNPIEQIFEVSITMFKVYSRVNNQLPMIRNIYSTWPGFYEA